MKIFITLFLSLIVCSASTNGLAIVSSDNAAKKDSTIQKMSEIDVAIKNINNDIKEVRRDQLNYKIEKDLMKEMYSSNIQIINIVIAIIASVFAFLGFFGLRDISSLQKSYKKELEKLTRIKSEFEHEIKNIYNEQNAAKQTYNEIIKTNEDQNIKIKLLEIRDKARSLAKEKNYYNAIEYCAIGLELDPKNYGILFEKAMAQFKLRQYANSIKTHLELLEIDSNSISVKVNLCELYLIVGDIPSYTALYDKIKIELVEKHNNNIDKYFEAFKLYIEKKESDLRISIADYLNTCESGKKKRCVWDFSDFLVFLKSQPNSSSKDLVKSLISFLDGETDKDEMLQLVNNSTPPTTE